MIILDAPYASRPLVQWLGQSQHPVPFDVRTVGAYGFLFLRTDEDTAGEREWLLHADLEAFADGEARR